MEQRWDERPRRTLAEIVRGRAAGRRSAIRFAMAVSAACAAVAGATVACLPGAPAGAAFGLGLAGLLFLLPFSSLYVPMLRPPVDMSRPFLSFTIGTALALAAAYLALLLLAATDKMLGADAVTGFLWGADLTGAASLGWFVLTTKDTTRSYIIREERLEVVKIG
ncbi:Os03g0179600 [Oryza sativa Japonica Group]|uniref:Os03g0179600 protein n=4 Tax=Oryza TaxID=4527 RepID=A0A0P0VTY4_ORYSJ|nr:Os03g0179600 [Oryza sativa Japonica Group]